MNDNQTFDVLVIGSGAAGLSLALDLSNGGATVGVISKSELTESSTFYAQGGIAAVLDETDSVESHIQDTLDSGAGLCNPDAVRFVVENGRAAIQKLIDYGVDFSREINPDTGNQEYHLTREGGHSHRRVIHAADATGRAVETTLVKKVQSADGITLLDHHMAVDLIRQKKNGKLGRCIGAYSLDIKNDRVVAYAAKAVVLATGGASKAYLYTSNPDGSTGDGIAMAWRAGADISNMEFTQFHPTCLFHPEAKSFLVTEAVRGEGGKLLLGNGKRFMDKFDERGELAPRDIVARAIDHEMKRTGDECVYLDISHKPADFITSHFPTVYKRCLDFGFDMTKQPIPVVPAAHYTCGGIATDLVGRTTVEGLYGIGEVACTGLHGANRIASNSLLECLVLGAAAARDILDNLLDMPAPTGLAPWDESWVRDSDEDVVVSHNWDEIRRFMWDYVGIVRTNKRLERAKHRIDLLQKEISDYYGNFRITGDLLELRNLAVVADLIVRAAMQRKESRGLHYTLDYLDMDNKQARPSVLVPEQKK